MLSVPVSVGELIDKLSILHVKKIKVTNPDKLLFINKEYDLLYYFSNISLSSNLDYAKVSVGVSRSAIWGQGYDLYLKKEKNEGKWVIEKTIEGEVW